jgi:hypothetical protein
MKEPKLDKTKINEYLQFLASFADDLCVQKLLLQEDLIRINREVDKFTSRLKEQNISKDFINCVQQTKIAVSQTSNVRPKNLLYYFVFYLLLGWVMIFVIRYKNLQDSLLRKEELREFKRRILAIHSNIDKYKLEK